MDLTLGESGLYLLSFVCMLVGLLGSILPGLPGAPVSFLGLLLLKFVKSEFLYSNQFLLIFGLLTILVVVLDNLLPFVGVRIVKASKASAWLSVIGLIIGIFFFPPFGMIFGMFLGAFVGELYATKRWRSSFKVGGFTIVLNFFLFLLKVGFSLILFYFYLRALIG